MERKHIYWCFVLIFLTTWIVCAETQDQSIPAVKLRLSDPVVVAQSPPEVTGWGPYQFPARLEVLPDGRIHLSYHLHQDDYAAYGLKEGHAISADAGQTWMKVDNPLGDDVPYQPMAGLLLPNGDRIAWIQVPSIKPDNIQLPEPIKTYKDGYGNPHKIYAAKSLPRKYRGWKIRRLPKGRSKWVEEFAQVNIPGEIRGVSNGVLTFPTFSRVILTPDGHLWNIRHNKRIVTNKLQEHSCVLIMQSVDNGKTWDILSEIPFAPDRSADPEWQRRGGFTEPFTGFMPDGSVLCLMRTENGGKHIGPMYWARSTDKGKTWSTPQIFDELGVWPVILTLKNGVTLTSYGRPGVRLRATADPAGLKWDHPVIVLDSPKTCSYTSLLPLDDHTALLAYSDFLYPQQNSTQSPPPPCKTILIRKVTAIPIEHKK